MSFAACQLAVRLDAKAITAPASNLGAAMAIARFRPSAPILIATESEQLSNALAAAWGIAAVFVPPNAESTFADMARKWLIERQLARSGDTIVILSAADFDSAGPDVLQIARV